MAVRSQDPGRDRTVAVFGATGHTGRFIVSELLRRGIASIAVGRDATKLAECGFADRGIEVREASTDDAGSLDRAFAGAAAVVNCAGPFLDTAHAVASAALRGRKHYLDVTAEQPSARATFETFDELARNAGVVVIPAMGFYGGLPICSSRQSWASGISPTRSGSASRWTAGTRRKARALPARKTRPGAWSSPMGSLLR
jgi:NAD(P)-dependent dehydrogenase (short-subunit alcohol dehydrogenase family)